jgi:hypothetical protein
MNGRWRIFWVLLAAGFAGSFGVGCGTDDKGDNPDAEAAVKLTLVQRSALTHPTYIEGAATFVRVTDAKGRVVAQAGIPVLRDGRYENGFRLDRLLATELKPGMYRVESWKRPCPPSGCRAGVLGDDPTDRCSAKVEVEARGPNTIFIATRAGRPCQVEPSGSPMGTR